MIFLLFIFLRGPIAYKPYAPVYFSYNSDTEFIAMIAVTTVKGFDGNYVPLLLVCLLVNIVVGIINIQSGKNHD